LTLGDSWQLDQTGRRNTKKEIRKEKEAKNQGHCDAEQDLEVELYLTGKTYKS
jgi:hypothetical protein